MKSKKFISERNVFLLGILLCTVFTFFSAKPNERPAWEQALAIFLFWMFGFLIKELYNKFPLFYEKSTLRSANDFFWISLGLITFYFFQKTFNLFG